MLTTAAGDVYNGRWEAGCLVGSAKITFHTGDVYVGDVDPEAPFARHGEGECRYAADGGSYVGQWEGDKRSGAGKLLSRREDYDGAWAEDAYHGRGVRKTTEGVHEEGVFARGELHGKGERRSAVGARWAGVFFDGKLRGEGTYRSPEGAEYVGAFSGGLQHGHGRCVYCLLYTSPSPRDS